LVLDDPFIDDHDREPDHDRERQQKIMPHVGVLDRNQGIPAHARLQAAVQRQCEGSHNGAGQNTPRESLGFKSGVVRPHQAARNNAQRINNRGHCRKDMHVLSLQRGGQQASDHVKELRRQDDADQVGERIDLARAGETWRDDIRQRPCEYHEQRDSNAPRQDSEIRDDAERFPTSLMVPAFEVLEEHGYEHDRQGAGRKQIVQKIRKREACEVDICLPAGAQRASDDLLANQTYDAAEKNGSGPDCRGNTNGSSLALYLPPCR
jgi:hypothetical protein